MARASMGLLVSYRPLGQPTFRQAIDFWRHKCDASAACRNLVGSYACECSPDYFAAEGALFGCGGFASTTKCCEGTGRG